MAKDTSLGLSLSKAPVRPLSCATVCGLCLLLAATAPLPAGEPQWYLPVNAPDRQSFRGVGLTAIGMFGEERRARPQVPAHLHTGIDIRRPDSSYTDQPVFPASSGTVVSVRDDGPYAQVIVRHDDVWSGTVHTVYEHLSGIRVAVGDSVAADRPLGRYMNRDELDSYGWQFDHLHFEVMKAEPRPVKPVPGTPQRLFDTFALHCRTVDELRERYWSPVEFLERAWVDADTVSLRGHFGP